MTKCFNFQRNDNVFMAEIYDRIWTDASMENSHLSIQIFSLTIQLFIKWYSLFMSTIMNSCDRQLLSAMYSFSWFYSIIHNCKCFFFTFFGPKLVHCHLCFDQRQRSMYFYTPTVNHNLYPSVILITSRKSNLNRSLWIDIPISHKEKIYATV